MAAINDLQLNILDLSVRKGRRTDARSIEETIDFAQAADRLGYHRFWVSEHHDHPALCNSSPEILICRLASLTERIRIGAGGIMLGNYAPLKIAEWASTLEILFPGRIDIGLGLSFGANPIAAKLLNPSLDSTSKDLREKIETIRSFLGNNMIDQLSGKPVAARPYSVQTPELWLLSTSPRSATMAAELGMPLSYAHFINPEEAMASAEVYKANLADIGDDTSNGINPAVHVVCAENEDKANELSTHIQMSLLQLERLNLNENHAYETVAEMQLSSYDRERLSYYKKRIISGTPQQVKSALLRLANETGASEITLLTITHELSDRIRSIELISEVFDLSNQVGKRFVLQT